MAEIRNFIKFVKVRDEWDSPMEDFIRIRLDLYHKDDNTGYCRLSANGDSRNADGFEILRFYEDPVSEEEAAKDWDELEVIFDNIPLVIDHQWFAANGFKKFF